MLTSVPILGACSVCVWSCMRAVCNLFASEHKNAKILKESLVFFRIILFFLSLSLAQGAVAHAPREVATYERQL